MVCQARQPAEVQEIGGGLTMEKRRIEFRLMFILEAMRSGNRPMDHILADAKAAEEFIFGKSGGE